MKKFLLLLIAASMIISLSACSGANYNFDLNEYITLGNYKGVSVSAAEVEAALEAQIDQLIAQQATTQNSTVRKAADGDTVNIDYVGKLDGVAYEEEGNKTTTAADQNITIGSGMLIDGFEESIIGHKGGDTYSVDLTFPEDYGPSENLRGKVLTFDITVNYVVETIKPDFDDEFVAANTDYTTVDEYKTGTKETMRSNAAWNTVVDSTAVKKYPEKNVKAYYDNTVKTYKNYASMYGTSFDAFITSSMGTDVNSFLKNIADFSKLQVKNEMVFFAIAKAEGLAVTAAEYDARLEKYLNQYKVSDKTELEKQYGKDNIKKSMLCDMVMEFVASNATDAE